MPQRIIIFLLVMSGLILTAPSKTAMENPKIPPGQISLKERNIYGDKIIVDKQNNILYLYENGNLSRSYRVATGEKPRYTPEGSFYIVNKSTLPPGTGNERFGPRWMGIGVPSHCDLRAQKPDERAPRGIKYGIHGTDEPGSIGKHASAGCIRLSNSDIVDLFDRVEVGTPVEIIH